MPRRNTIEIIIKGTDKASGALGKIGKIVGNLGKAAMIGLGAIGVAGVAAGAALTKLAIDAAPLEGIEAAFRGITEASGEMADEMLASLQKSSAGMVSQRDLMTSYNLAAQLVGDTFANQLPDAMEYLTKVSAATGQGMDYMMDSLVRGVGRLSPMILDNLGISVNVTEAYEDWAKAMGKTATTMVDNSTAIAELSQDLGFAERELTGLEQAFHRENAELINARNYWAEGSNELLRFEARVDKAKLALDKKAVTITEQRAELAKLQAGHGSVIASTEDLTASMTKAQQQEALMAYVMKKLAENTAALPDVTDTAATSIAGLKAKFADAKDAIGIAFLPVVKMVAVELSDLADRVLPLVVPAIEALTAKFEAFMAFMEDIQGSNLSEFFLALIPTNLQDNVRNLIGHFEQLVEWLQVNVPVAIQVASDFWTGTLLPALEVVRAWFEEKWPIIAAVVLTAWEVIKAAIESAVAVIVETAWPKLQDAFNTLTEVLAEFGISWSDVWDAIKRAVGIVAIVIGAILLALVAIITGVITGIAEGLQRGIEAFRGFSEFVEQIIEGVAIVLAGWGQVWEGILTRDFETVIEGFKTIARGWLLFVKGIVNSIITVFNGLVATVIGLLEGFIEGIVSWFEEMHDRLVGGSIVPDMINAIVGWFAKLPELILEVLSVLVDGVAALLKGLFGPILEFDPAQVAELFASLLVGIQALAEAWRAFSTYLLEESWPMLQEEWMMLLTLMQDEWTMFITLMLERWVQAMIKMLAEFAKLVAAVLAGIQQMMMRWNEMKAVLDLIAKAIEKIHERIKDLTSNTMLARLQKLIEKFEALERAAKAAAAAMKAVVGGNGGGDGAAAPGLQSGLWQVSREMLARLHPGEMVLPANVASAFRGAVAGSVTTDNRSANYNLTINTSAPSEPIAADFELLKALAGA